MEKTKKRAVKSFGLAYAILLVLFLSYTDTLSGAVASENDKCSKIGTALIRQGGSAVDAAIGAAFCIGTTNMYSSGIGGGFMLIRAPPIDDGYVYINFREEAPMSAHRDMFIENPMDAQVGGKSICVPGELRGFEMAHKIHGKLPWHKLIEPSINLARNGWIVDDMLAKRIQSVSDIILDDIVLSSVFAPMGKILVKGDTIYRKKYALTLEAIAKDVSVFYTGWIANELVSTINKLGGNMTLEDFASYKAKAEAPVFGTYKGYTVVSTPPPSSGVVLMAALNILENYSDFEDNNLNSHRLVEVFKHVYAQRGFYGDPTDPVYKNISKIGRYFSRKAVANKIFGSIVDNSTFEPSYYEPVFDVKEDHGTMHLSVATSAGDAVAMTSTINLLFGSKIMDAKTGIILNNHMDDFSTPNHTNYFGLPPSPYNYIFPKKRPQSSSVPTIISKGDNVMLVAGASGGSHIISSTLQTILHVLERGTSAQDAVNHPRIHHQLFPNSVFLEANISKETSEFLNLMGHITNVANYTVSGVSIVANENGALVPAGDPRKGGAGSVI